jgi:hypothetical protein
MGSGRETGDAEEAQDSEAEARDGARSGALMASSKAPDVVGALVAVKLERLIAPGLCLSS